MAFVRTALQAHPGMNINAAQSWGYQTTDATATVAGAGYFAGAADLLDKGAIIEVVSDMGTTPVLKRYVATVVTKPVPATGTAGAVTIVLQTTT